MPIMTLEQLIIALIDLNYSAREISRMSTNDMYYLVYNEVSRV